MKNNDYIVKYFNNELQSQERILFEQRCEQDDAFAREVAIFLHMKAIAKEELKNNLKTLYSEPTTNTTNRNWLWGAVIVVALLATAVGVFYWMQSQKATEVPTPELLYATLTPPDVAVRGDENNAQIDVQDLYAQGNFDSLITLANQVDVLQIEQLNWLITKALAQFGKGDYTAVVQTIEGFQNAHPNNAIGEDELLWLQSLAYWKLNNMDAARTNWQILVDENYKYSSEAKQLLEL